MMKTPAVREAANMVGIKELTKTPAVKEVAYMVGVKELMKTPRAVPLDMSGMEELLKTPGAKLNPFASDVDAATPYDTLSNPVTVSSPVAAPSTPVIAPSTHIANAFSPAHHFENLTDQPALSD